ncbi:hypothetical protein J4573_11520 [Actinomadura barringtoniae]|uniref:Uncharacterized protein n=1 Tax=Actinomadura barringtoniae TaxID=1427535 RepID=A0A939P8J8_9ACTN|nr:hypothetical protein [Actinomadura barringtoniae]MBO2447720.1 hypothetical protein [Actinomadura barringtoniae]
MDGSQCDCGKDAREAHRDRCAELAVSYARLAEATVHGLAPVLNDRRGAEDVPERLGTDRLREAARLLECAPNPARHGDRVSAAGRLLFAVPGDVAAAYLGTRLTMIGQHLVQRRPPARTEMLPLAQAYHLMNALRRGCVMNDPSDARLPCLQCRFPAAFVTWCEHFSDITLGLDETA